jgi:phage terminase small subunit
MAKTRAKTAMKHTVFVRVYLANGGNATLAYQAAYPAANKETAAVNGWHLLRNTKIKAQIRSGWEKALAKRKIEADTVIGMVIDEATADIRELYGADEKLLPPPQWPTRMTHCIQSVDLDKGRIKLTDQSNARKFLLELSGRTRNAVADSIDHMAEAILADRAKHLKGTP